MERTCHLERNTEKGRCQRLQGHGAVRQERDRAVQMDSFKLRVFSQIWGGFIPWGPLVELQFKWNQLSFLASLAVKGATCLSQWE